MIFYGTFEAYYEWMPPPPKDVLILVDYSAIINLFGFPLLSISLNVAFWR